MKRIITLLLALPLFLNLNAQGVNFGIYTGGGKMFDSGVIDMSTQANNLLLIQQNSLNAKDDILKTSRSAEFTPMAFSIGFGQPFEIGLKYSFYTSGPKLYYPIGDSNLIGVEEKLRANSFSLYLRKNSVSCGDDGFNFFYGIESGKRWGKKIIDYTEHYKTINADARDEKIKLKPAYFVSIHGGVGYELFDNFIFEVAAVVTPFQKYQVNDQINKTTTHSLGINAGIRIFIEDSPCLW